MQEIVRHTATSHAHVEHFPWDWQIPIDLFMAAMVGGILIITAWKVLFNREEESSPAFRLATWFAPLFLGVAMVALLLDLSKPLQAYRFFLALEITAPMSWGSWLILAIFPVSILFALAQLPDNWRAKLEGSGLTKWLLPFADWAKKEPVFTRLAWTGLVLGIAFGLYTGVLLGNISARPLWGSMMLAPLFLASGLACAAAVILLTRINDVERTRTARFLFVLLMVSAALMAFYIIPMVNGPEVLQQNAELLLGGEFTAAFWSLVIIAGLLVPIVALAWQMKKQAYSSWVAPVLVLVGGYALRWILTYAGQISSW